jgi:DNA-binding transcriptional regulator WhiA
LSLVSGVGFSIFIGETSKLPTKTLQLSKMANLNIEVPDNMLKEIDDLIKTGRYATRSEVVRDGVRDILERNRNNTQ